MKRNLLLAAGTMMALLLLVVVALPTRNSQLAKKTMWCMGRISVAFDNSGAKWRTYTEDSFLAFLADSRLEKCSVDGWGNKFKLEVKSSDGERLHLRIRSLGSDGAEGECCTKFLPKNQWNEDAVLEDGEWLQVWQ